MNIVFIGPPYIGKGTQSELLGKRLGLPVFSMGTLIRQARDAGNQEIARAFEEYSMKGLHVPIEIKFLSENSLSVDKVFLINISDQESQKRMIKKEREGRPDDDPEVVIRRIEIQGKERIPVINYFREKGILEEIDGERKVEKIHRDILNRLGI